MTHVVTVHRGRDGLGPGLVLELGGVHAEHHERVAVQVLQYRQLVEHPEAVHTAGGPEVEQDDPAAQLVDADVASSGAQPAPSAQCRCPYP